MIITQVSGKTSNLACTVKNLGNQTVIRCSSTYHDHHDHRHYHDEEDHGGDRHEYNDVEALSLEYRQCVNFWLKSLSLWYFYKLNLLERDSEDLLTSLKSYLHILYNKIRAVENTENTLAKSARRVGDKRVRKNAKTRAGKFNFGQKPFVREIILVGMSTEFLCGLERAQWVKSRRWWLFWERRYTSRV